MLLPRGTNEQWSLDLVSDAYTDRRRFRLLAVFDDFSRECLALVAGTSLSGLRVTRELDPLIRLCGKPGTLVSNNRAELVQHGRAQCSWETSVDWHPIQPGKPMRDGFGGASTADSGTCVSTRRCAPREKKGFVLTTHGFPTSVLARPEPGHEEESWLRRGYQQDSEQKREAVAFQAMVARVCFMGGAGAGVESKKALV
ncbi:DDE-type integrase/transposase/recombinase [Nitratireductor kimnyeongensis]|uniref:DDE-type integrase/transposase/recombinase n=2 Tax=Nitratireductor kimnyeongensis TaxID=430679 RepID=A0ABW0T7Z5_9HYPH